MRFIGLDLHKRSLEVCILSEKGSVLARHSIVCERFALNRFAEKHLEGTDKHLAFVIEDFDQPANSVELLGNRKGVDIWH